jgi:gamma-glutamyl:cysteine ligase YbdK (ATP-grasp superfamily)
VLAENRFLASRDGIGGRLVEGSPARMRPAVEFLGELLERCRSVAPALGCADELEAVAATVASPGHARQRALVRRQGLTRLPAGLAAEFAVAGPVGATVPVTSRT